MGMPDTVIALPDGETVCRIEWAPRINAWRPDQWQKEITVVGHSVRLVLDPEAEK